MKVKSRFNRHLLDSGLGELRRQLEYKTSWYGSHLIVLDKGEPTASKCSKCRERNPNSKPSDKRFTCL
ncbi:zinc ribbon domain-containing protein, partial [Streptomyces syringium]|uniref:zinc ribbon domain-containing protein n=1 Tax=Streptomyces syringium TaxID=76729 RepID=UPI0033D46EED